MEPATQSTIFGLDMLTTAIGIGVVVLLGGVVAYWFFSSGNARSHAKPTRFFWMAFVALCLGFFANILSEEYSRSATTATQNLVPLWKQLASMLTLVCGAFAGALASVAITNRAQYLHAKEVVLLTKELATIQTLVQDAINNLSPYLKKPALPDPYDAMMMAQEKLQIDNAIQRQMETMEKMMERLNELKTEP